MRLHFRLALVVLSAATLAAQSPSGVINGLVLDPAGRAIAGASVLVVNDATGVLYSGRTNQEGIYVIPNLAPGPYRLQVAKVGFKTLIKPDIVLNVQGALAINFTLPVGAYSETLTIEGGARLLDTQSAAVSTVVDRNFAENLPLNGRSFQTLIDLTPGVVVCSASYANQGQFSVNGQRSDANYFTVDGVSANIGITAGNGLAQSAAGSLPGLSILGGTNSLVSVDAMQEFRVQTSSFAPEFGPAPGGQVSIVTRSGTNDRHGTLFNYLRNDVFDANDWFSSHNALAKPEERQNDFGGVFGGPVLKDRTFFFFSYEGLRLRQPMTTETIVPDSAARAQAPSAIRPYLNAFPRPSGAELGGGLAQFNSSYSNPSTLDAYGIRIDHLASRKLAVFVRYNYSPSETVERQTSALSSLELASSTAHTFTLGMSESPREGLSNEVRLNYSNSSGSLASRLDSFGGAVPPAASLMFPAAFSSQNSSFGLAILGTGTGSSGYGALSNGEAASNEQRQLNGVDNLSIASGAHQFKFGIDYRWLSPLAGSPAYQQQLAFTGVAGPAGSALSGVAADADIQSSQGFVELLSQNFSLYGEDSWKPGPRLTLTYGLRWDLDPAMRGKGPESQLFRITNLDDPARLALASRGGPLYPTELGNVAPRLGVAYQLGQSPGWQSVVRAGAGIFYDFSNGGSLGEVTYGFPFQAISSLFLVPLPLTAGQAAPPPLTTNLPAAVIYVADPDLRQPRTYQWNLAVEQALGASQTLSLTYVGAAGRNLLRTETLFSPNPNFHQVSVSRSSSTSSYHALQVKFNRRLAGGLQVLASYTLSHSIDNASNDSSAYTPSLIANPNIDRGASDFDVRHSLTGALAYSIPASSTSAIRKALLAGWSVDSFLTVRSATPVDLIGAYFMGGGVFFNQRPDIVPGEPFCLYGPQYPGGKAFNPRAFVRAAAGEQGSLGRNELRGFGAWQDDFAVHRQFRLSSRVNMQFRAEFFNVFNHANFGPPTNTVGSALFGQATETLASALGGGGASGGLNPLYQIGGARSIQPALKLEF